MAPRPFWKGYLKLTLVACPVAMMPALTDEEKVRFTTVNRKTGNRVMSRYVDAVTGKVVEDDDQIRGYEHAEGKYVMLEEDEIDAVALDSTRTIDIDLFIGADEIPALFLDRPHYLFPDDEVGEEAFAVIRAAMEETGTVGIARLVLYRRERAVMIEPRGRGMVVWTLRYGDEVRPPGEHFGELEKEKAGTKARTAVVRLLSQEKQGWEPGEIDDPVNERLREIIAEHKKARKKTASKKSAPRRAEPEKSNVVNIMDALRQSLDKDRKTGRK